MSSESKQARRTRPYRRDDRVQGHGVLLDLPHRAIANELHPLWPQDADRRPPAPPEGRRTILARLPLRGKS